MDDNQQNGNLNINGIILNQNIENQRMEVAPTQSYTSVAPHLLFSGQNYLPWKIRIIREIELVLKCPKAIAAIPEDENDNDRARRKIQKDKAAGMVLNRLADEQILLTRQCETVREIFEILDAKYSKSSRTNAATYLLQLDALKIDPKKGPEEYFKEFQMLQAKLHECGKLLEDDDICIKYVNALPNALSSLRTNCRGMMRFESITSDHIRSQIIDEMDEYTRQRKENPKGKAVTAKSMDKNVSNKNKSNTSENSKSADDVKPKKKKNYEGRFDKSKVTCHRCQQKGHFANECTKTANQVSSSAPTAEDKTEKFARIAFSALQSDAAPEPITSAPVAGEIKFQGDSGANFHMINQHRDHLINVRELSVSDGKVRVANNKWMQATHQGDLRVKSLVNGVFKHGIIKDVLYVPELHRNLLATTNYMTDGYSLTGENGKVHIRNPEGEVVIVGVIVNKVISINLYLPEEKFALISMHERGTLWHKRMGHMNGRYVERLSGITEGVPSTKVLENMANCQVCSESKMKKLPFKNSHTPAKKLLDHLYCDLIGKIIPMSEEGYQYIFVIVDEWSRYVFTYNLESKEDVADQLIGHLTFVQTMLEIKVKKITSDNGPEFKNQLFKGYCNESGIDLEFIPPYTPELNGTVERLNGTIGNRIRALLYQAHLPLEYWGYAADVASFLINRSPHSSIDFKTPYEKWYGEKPDMQFIRVFGCVARVHVPDELRSKLEKKSWTGILLGFSSTGYKVYNFESRNVEMSRHVMFDESNDIRSIHPNLQAKQEEKLIIKNERTIGNIENIIINDFHADAATLQISYDEAMKDIHAAEYRKAVQDEFDIIEQRQVWKLVPYEKQHLIDSRWVITRKTNEDGTHKYRARLCARGFKDRNEYNLTDTYSPTAKLSTVRLLLALSVEMDWENHHIDISSAFLYGELDHDIHMKVPQGMQVDGTKYVLKLERALYGLKVAAKQWNVMIVNILSQADYTPLVSEHCLFRNRNNCNSALILAFVDDLLVTGPYKNEQLRIIEFLRSKLSLRNMGRAEKFLGIHIGYHDGGIYLEQNDYITECCEKYQVSKKKFATPMETNLKIDPNSPDPEINLRPIIGSLMYTAISCRPDVCYSVNFLSRFQINANRTLYTYAQRIFAYLRTTIDKRLTFIKSSRKLLLSAVSDASFAADSNDRRSTSGLVIFLNSNPILWLSRKQRSITKSATEAEYMSMSLADSEIRAVSNILNELNFHHNSIIQCDNTGAKSIAEKSYTKGCRHVEIAYRSVEESVTLNRLSVEYVPGNIIVSDLLTKALPKVKHNDLTNVILNHKNDVV